MEYTEYNFKGKVNTYEFTKHLPLAEEIRKFFPKNVNLRVEESISSYFQKGKKEAVIEMKIEIFSENGKQREDIKAKLEEILGQELTKQKI